jgi:hypothetical protein
MPMANEREPFEVTPKTFDGSNTSTDHLVIWVMAKSIEDVRAKYPEHDIEPMNFMPYANEIDEWID